MRRLAVTTALVLLALAAPAAAQDAHSPNLTHVANLPYEARNGTTPNYGTDIEFARIGDRQYALAGSYRNGLQIVDITDPEQARIAAVYDCGITQGDPQVFTRGERTYVTYTSDTYGDGTSTCYREAAALGFEVLKADGTGRNGTFIVDITDPLARRRSRSSRVEQGSHNQTVHPSGNYLYNSNCDLITTTTPAIEVFDIRDFAAPRKVAELALPLAPGPRHRVARHHVQRERRPRLLGRALAGRDHRHQRSGRPEHRSPASSTRRSTSAPGRPVHADRRHRAQRDFLIVEDEFAGAAGFDPCPSGGLHVYDITGPLEATR